MGLKKIQCHALLICIVYESSYAVLILHVHIFIIFNPGDSIDKCTHLLEENLVTYVAAVIIVAMIISY